MNAAEVSSWPRSMPWRASRGKAWWLLCHDSPIVNSASAGTLVLVSRVANDLVPTVWQTELIDHVKLWLVPILITPAMSNAPTAPASAPVQR
jgi:hypothetical protein